jgi:hypothetical protein
MNGLPSSSFDWLQPSRSVLALLELEFLASFLGGSSALPSAKHEFPVLDFVVRDVAEPAMTAHVALANP